MRMEKGKIHASKQLRKSAAKTFITCPSCASPNILKFEGEAFCTFCGWDSVALSLSLDAFQKIKTNQRENSYETNQSL